MRTGAATDLIQIPLARNVARLGHGARQTVFVAAPALFAFCSGEISVLGTQVLARVQGHGASGAFVDFFFDGQRYTCTTTTGVVRVEFPLLVLVIGVARVHLHFVQGNRKRSMDVSI